jgi:hypothetical protein
MNLDEQLTELLAGLGVVLEGTPVASCSRDGAPYDSSVEAEDVTENDAAEGGEEALPSELCLFQTSREHYGVFYRLDLVDGAPQLRIFAPDEASPVKMRCYLVRAAAGAPLRAWFSSTRTHAGSDAFDDARDTAQQHLLFAAGELMKRLFWDGDPDERRFPPEIEVRRLV